jgi:serine/threonine protein kinase
MTVGPGGQPRVPDRIPTEPDRALSWDVLTERERLGSGETADVVAMGVDGTDEVVAVKQPRLDSTLASETVERFVAEAEKWSKLDDHDHIVGVVDWGETPLPWIALEHMDGGSLTERLGGLSTEEGLWVAVCAANGVWGAHRRGVAHLDLTPDNVLFRTTPGDHWDVPKVSDWGLARLLLDQSADVGGLSPRYASPEQLAPDTYGAPDDRSDIYQLGAIVYELLTGEPVFAGAATTVTDRHLNEAPTPPSRVDQTLPSAADDVVLGALAKEKEARYESMLDFRRELGSLFDQVTSGDAEPLTSGRGTETRHDSSMSDRFDPFSSDAPGSEQDPRSDGTLEAGSSIGPGADGTRILDRIREQSRADHDRRVPWQQREDAPGIEQPSADDRADERGDDGAGTDDAGMGAGAGLDEQDGSTDGETWYAAGVAVGLLVSVVSALAGFMPGLVPGGMLLVISFWLLAGDSG